jgi:MFS family permease
MVPPQEGTMDPLLHEPLLTTATTTTATTPSSRETDTASIVAAEHDMEDDDNNHHSNFSSSNKNISVSMSYVTCGCSKTTITLNQNVWLDIIVCSTYGLSTSLANGTAFAAYVKKIGGNRNGPLGNIEAAEGLASLCTALPIGYLADRVGGRSKVIGAGGIMIVVVGLTQIVLMEWIQHQHEQGDSGSSSSSTTTSTTSTTALWLLGACMSCWGMADGIIEGPASALLADSTPQGQRSIYYTYIFVGETLASCIGPLVSILLFQTLGDNWDLYHLKCVIYVGLGFSIFNGILLLFYDDTKALAVVSSRDDENNDDEEEEEEDDSERDTNDQSGNATATTTTTTHEQDTAEQGVLVDNVPTLLGRDSEAASSRTLLQKRQRWIPYILFVSSLVIALGSGMTVKFFPLFFKDDIGMTPSQVQGVYVCAPLASTLLSYLCNRIADQGGFGRVITTLIATSLGIACLFSMVLLKAHVHPFVLVPIFVLQSGLMTATFPIMESILMDFCPKEQRARWSSLVESVAACGWCGSAALGGYLADQHDYSYTFVITALLQAIGLLIFALLLPLVPRSEGGGDGDDDDDDEDDDEAAVLPPHRFNTTFMMCGANYHGNDNEQEPLLQRGDQNLSFRV